MNNWNKLDRERQQSAQRQYDATVTEPKGSESGPIDVLERLLTIEATDFTASQNILRLAAELADVQQEFRRTWPAPAIHAAMEVLRAGTGLRQGR